MSLKASAKGWGMVWGVVRVHRVSVWRVTAATYLLRGWWCAHTHPSRTQPRVRCAAPIAARELTTPHPVTPLPAPGPPRAVYRPRVAMRRAFAFGRPSRTGMRPRSGRPDLNTRSFDES